jgi:hypothetical protein
MPYSAPSGWVEDHQVSRAGDRHGTFHTKIDCPRIQDLHRLRQVERPYSAARCRLCAEQAR